MKLPIITALALLLSATPALAHEGHPSMYTDATSYRIPFHAEKCNWAKRENSRGNSFHSFLKDLNSELVF